MPKPELILLALEDSPILKLMDRALRAIKYETATANDTASLARILQESTPSLLLVGEKFGGHNGFDISVELLGRFPTLPILIYAEKETPDLVKSVFRRDSLRPDHEGAGVHAVCEPAGQGSRQ